MRKPVHCTGLVLVAYQLRAERSGNFVPSKLQKLIAANKDTIAYDQSLFDVFQGLKSEYRLLYRKYKEIRQKHEILGNYAENYINLRHLLDFGQSSFYQLTQYDIHQEQIESLKTEH